MMTYKLISAFFSFGLEFLHLEKILTIDYNHKVDADEEYEL